MKTRFALAVLRCGTGKPSTAPRWLTCQERLFSSSKAVYQIPRFPETSSPELDALLEKFRSKVFFPAHLDAANRKLVYGQKYRQKLRDEPVDVKIDGETFRLEFIDRHKDLPGVKQGIDEMLGLFSEKSDWATLPLFLEGLHACGDELKPGREIALIRFAGKKGRVATIVDCIRRSKRTGFLLRNTKVVVDIIWQIADTYAHGKTSPERIASGLKLAEEVVSMLELPQHRVDGVSAKDDGRSRPEVIGILLELAASNAKATGKDDERTVQAYAERLLGSIANGNSLKDAESRNMWDEARRPRDANPEWDIRNWQLRNMVAVASGVKTAIPLLDAKSDTVRRLRELDASLTEQLTIEKNWLESNPAPRATVKSLGLRKWEEAFGPTA